ncbi:testis-expressed protein 44 [Peromyscus eremicus]|uniref:testis-expressed protein 44 n=1 Tax=Peromyscus eremicus TaxID=42410 RepID=UPI0027DCEF70|nr:testis-expressed protein 44 [Peromyscus eremicus]
MTTGPLEEAEATSRPVYDLPEASVGSEADNNSENLPGKSHSPDFLPEDEPPADATEALAEGQDVDPASVATTFAPEQDEDPVSTDANTFMGQDEDQASLQTATSTEQYVDQVSTQYTALIGQDEDQASVKTTTSTEQYVDQVSTQITALIGQDEDQASVKTATSTEQYVDQVSTQITALIGQDEDQVPLPTATSTEQDEHQESTQITAVNGQDEHQVSTPTATSMGQDGIQASMQMATSTGQDVETAISMDISTSGDKEESPDAPSHNQENPEEITSLLPQEPGILQVFVGFQNPVWDRLAENNRASRSRTVSPSDSQHQEKTPGKPSVPEGQPEIAPNADVPSALPEDVQPSAGATDPSTLDTSSPNLEPTDTESAEQEAEGFRALNPESQVRAPGATREDLADDSTIPQTPPSLSSPAGSPPPSPDPCHVALGRNLLDLSLYRSDVENDYMRSMTSLLGGGEGSISSLADILVWSDTATGMGLAVGFLASGHSSPADRLRDEGPSLRTVSSILGSARSAFSSGLVAGTGSALRSVTHLLESVERRTAEGIRSAMRYLVSHFTPRWARTAPNSD